MWDRRHDEASLLESSGHMIPLENLDQEFDAVLNQLKARWASQQATQLLHKSHLSEDEKKRLRELLGQGAK